MASAVVKRVENLLERKPHIQKPGRLLAHIRHELGGQFTHEQIADALDKLDTTGAASVEKAGGVYNGVRSTLPRRRRTKSELTPQAKRESMYAKGVPSSLPDSYCTPVVISHVGDRDLAPKPADSPRAADSLVAPIEQRQEEVAVTDSDIRGKIVTVDNLNLALMALREKCDENGIVQARSAVSVIEEALGCTKSQAGSLNTMLGLLGFRSMGKGYKPVKVVFDPEYVTGEIPWDLAALRRQNAQLQADESSSRPTDLASEEVIKEDPSVEASQEAVVLIEQLTGIVRSLESRLEDCDRAAAKLVCANDVLRRQNEDLKQEIEQRRDAQQCSGVYSEAVSIVQRYSTAQ